MITDDSVYFWRGTKLLFEFLCHFIWDEYCDISFLKFIINQAQGIFDTGGILVLTIPMLVEIFFDPFIEVCVVIDHYCGIDFVE